MFYNSIHGVSGIFITIDPDNTGYVLQQSPWCVRSLYNNRSRQYRVCFTLVSLVCQVSLQQQIQTIQGMFYNSIHGVSGIFITIDPDNTGYVLQQSPWCVRSLYNNRYRQYRVCFTLVSLVCQVSLQKQIQTIQGMFYNSLLGVSGLFTTIDPDNTGYVLHQYPWCVRSLYNNRYRQYRVCFTLVSLVCQVSLQQQIQTIQGMFYNSLLGVSGLFTTTDPDNTGYVLQQYPWCVRYLYNNRSRQYRVCFTIVSLVCQVSLQQQIQTIQGMFYTSLLGVSGLFTTIDPDNTGCVLQQSPWCVRSLYNNRSRQYRVCFTIVSF